MPTAYSCEPMALTSTVFLKLEALQSHLSARPNLVKLVLCDDKGRKLDGGNILWFDTDGSIHLNHAVNPRNAIAVTKHGKEVVINGYNNTLECIYPAETPPTIERPTESTLSFATYEEVELDYYDDDEADYYEDDDM